MLDNTLRKVLLLGSGALKIGEAGEFDYSGSQALKALREEGIETVLINPNIATVQTSEGIADKIYFLPVTPSFVERVIEKEKPQGIFLSFGGQTALNCGVELYRSGVLARHGVRVLGTPVQSIIDTEDRDLFVHRLDEIGVKTIRSHAASSVGEALTAAAEVGYPVILRAAYALGGLGSGFCDNEAELTAAAGKAFAFSPQVLVEKSLKGWKEIEYEVVRDRYDNCITVCNMENFDPLGIHTGESIVVAPSQTLTNDEFHFLRKKALDIVRHLGIVGECNVQYAFSPDGEDYRVIEVNARLSRSSALASKATGYPLAFVAAKLGLGYGLFELKNSVTQTTPAFFEPALDYVVCKIPRWDLAKFKGVSREIGSSMKSVGEVMAIGRTFEEAIQKGLRMIGQGANGFVCNKPYKVEDLDWALEHPTDTRIFAIAAAFESGYSVDRIHALTRIDKWFLDKLFKLETTYRELEACPSLSAVGRGLFMRAKRQGFSDIQIARVFHIAEEVVRQRRHTLGLRPCIKQIDTLAAEFPAKTNYLYLTYSGTKSDIIPPYGAQTVIVLGSGAYRIGSSVEFDWCGVNAVDTFRRKGWQAVMINYNPETVSTDYDSCDRLYFDELSLETVLEICTVERPFGVVVSVGGQIPNNLALPLQQNGINILGTRAEDIDRAEDRNKFSSIVDRLGIDQPRWQELTTMDDIEHFVADVGYPVLVRPSYVLSGAAMNVCYSDEDLKTFLEMAVEVSAEHPVVISSFIQRCKEFEFDAVSDQGRVLVHAISEHIEYAGVHSGDATIQFPPQKLYCVTAARIRRVASAIAAELHISGPFNIQFLAHQGQVKVIECNLRASRSFPFVSKILKLNFIDLAVRCMLGEHPLPPDIDAFELPYVGVKASQFSFSRLGHADPVLGVDMASTGEVGCIGDNFDEALLKAMISVGHRIPKKAVLISSGNAIQKADMLPACQMLHSKGFEIYATWGTWRYLQENGVPAKRIRFPNEAPEAYRVAGAEGAGGNGGVIPAALDLIRQHEVELVVNIPKNFTHGELTNGYRIRRAAIDFNVPLITNSRLATAYIRAFCSLAPETLPVKAWDEYR
ncbi:MAG: carbamoyl-phosphate synthase (glutamine-hydrolyzing) large subunit [Bacteroidales bacterium]|nr:carbamoyl-phosphate synthase (glutamine-hydrolyzing) large subunit [Bacteroidales bacterium]